MEYALRVQETIKTFRETRLSNFRPVTEFFDYSRVSRPGDFNQATSRLSYNTRYFSGNYGIIFAALAIYAIISNRLLLFGIGLLIGGLYAINKFAPEETQVGSTVVTQRNLYIALFVIDIPILLWAGPFSTVFWIVGASALLIINHAVLMEPGVESEYATVQESV